MDDCVDESHSLPYARIAFNRTTTTSCVCLAPQSRISTKSCFLLTTRGRGTMIPALPGGLCQIGDASGTFYRGISVWRGIVKPALRNGPMDRTAAFTEERFHAPARGIAAPCIDARSPERLSPDAATPLPFPPDHAGRAFPLACGPLPHPFDPRPCHDGDAGFSLSGFFPSGAQDVPESDGLQWRRNL